MEIQKDIRDWTKVTFVRSSGISKMHHLIKEVKELYESIDTFEPELEYDEIEEEIGDCMILLFDIAGFYDIDAIEAVKKKHEINKKRQWGEPDAYGVVNHISEDK